MVAEASIVEVLAPVFVGIGVMFVDGGDMEPALMLLLRFTGRSGLSLILLVVIKLFEIRL